MNPQRQFSFAEHFDPSEFIAKPQPPTPVQQELTRRSANADAILARLRTGPATNGELMDIGGLRYGGRLFELRKQGYEIETIPGEKGKYTYRLVSEPRRTA